MLVLFASNDRSLSQLASSTPDGTEVIATSEWEEVERASLFASCVVVGATLRGHELMADRVQRLRDEVLVPLVFVIPCAPEVIRVMLSRVDAEVVWWSEHSRALAPAIRLAIGSGVLQQAADNVETAPEVPIALGAALATACRASSPITSVARLAKEAGVSERWLQRMWSDVAAESQYRLTDFLDWVLLVRVSLAKGATSAEMEKLTGRRRRTLDRASRRLVGTSVERLRRAPAQHIADDFWGFIQGVLGGG